MVKARHAEGGDRALVELWLQHLGRKTHMRLGLDEDGVCTIGHRAGLDCVVEVPGNGSVYLRVAILPWEPEENPDLAERCLLASFMGIETGGAAFGVDPMDAMLILWQERPLSALDEARFFVLVTNILGHAVRLRDDLTEAEAAAAREAAHDRRPPANFNMLRA